MDKELKKKYQEHILTGKETDIELLKFRYKEEHRHLRNLWLKRSGEHINGLYSEKSWWLRVEVFLKDEWKILNNDHNQ